MTSQQRRFFDQVKTNNDDKAEFAEVDNSFKTLDLDNWDTEEFKVNMDTLHTLFTGYDIILYKFFHKNSHGTLHKKDLENLFKSGDKNNDGIILKTEFVHPFTPVVKALEFVVNNTILVR